MYYTIYEIVNNINNNVYIGCHKTENLDDGYMGSGKLIKLAIKKYGKRNFTKNILNICKSPEDMYTMESELVNEEFVSRRDTYNMKEGGYGIPNLDNLIDGSIVKQRLIKSGEWDNFKRNISESLKVHYQHNDPHFKGKKHSQETKDKIGEANKIHQTGNGNSQYGTMWITNGTESKKIKKDTIIPEGWNKGRKIKT